VVLTWALLAAAGCAWRSSYSAFASTTGNSGNSIGTGTVSLADGAAGIAVLNNISGLTSGSTGSVITYTGTARSRLQEPRGRVVRTAPASGDDLRTGPPNPIGIAWGAPSMPTWRSLRKWAS
jgi:hypothetical protein